MRAVALEVAKVIVSVAVKVIVQVVVEIIVATIVKELVTQGANQGALVIARLGVVVILVRDIVGALVQEVAQHDKFKKR